MSKVKHLPQGQAVAAGLEGRVWSSAPGNRAMPMQVLGSSGRKKVQDLFVDRKVPRVAASQVPIVDRRRWPDRVGRGAAPSARPFG